MTGDFYLSEIEKCIDQTIKSLGHLNPVLTQYYYIKLSYLIQSRGKDDAFFPMIVETIETIENFIFSINKISILDKWIPSTDLRVIPDLDYSFYKDYYKKHYLKYLDIYKLNISDRFVKNGYGQDLLDRFIYVIGGNGEFRYYNKPQPVKMGIVANKDIDIFPFHPILAHDFDLKISVAGEICFMWPLNSVEPDVIMINNRSGHYMPVDWKCKDLSLLIRRVMNLNDTVSVISFTNDGACVSGRLATEISEKIKT